MNCHHKQRDDLCVGHIGLALCNSELHTFENSKANILLHGISILVTLGCCCCDKMLDTKNLKEEVFPLVRWFMLTWTHISGSGEAGQEGRGACL